MPAYDHTKLATSVKSMLRYWLKDFQWRVKGLAMDDGSTDPLPLESSAVGNIIERYLIAHLKF